MEKADIRENVRATGRVELKAGIMAALNNVQKLTIPRSEDWEEIEKKKAAVQKEEDEARLHVIYRMLRETLVVDAEGKTPSMRVRMPDGTMRVYSSYEEFQKNGPRDAAVSMSGAKPRVGA